MTEMYRFETANFTVVAMIEPDHDLDLSWDETGEVADKLERGVYEAFETKVAVYHGDTEIGADYLGGSIYENPRDFFKEHIGAKGKYGSYFRDMVRSAIAEARKNYKPAKPVKLRAAK